MFYYQQIIAKVHRRPISIDSLFTGKNKNAKDSSNRILFVRYLVRCHVALERSGVRETTSTLGTSERFLTSVGTHMRFHISRLCESLATNVTSPRTLIRVQRQSVAIELRPRLEAFRARLAGEEPLVAVDESRVNAHSTGRLEQLTASNALMTAASGDYVGRRMYVARMKS